MKTRISFLLALAATFAMAFGAPAIPDWTSKIVAIKTTREGSSGIRIDNSAPAIGQFNIPVGRRIHLECMRHPTINKCDGWW